MAFWIFTFSSSSCGGKSGLPLRPNATQGSSAYASRANDASGKTLMP